MEKTMTKAQEQRQMILRELKDWKTGVCKEYKMPVKVLKSKIMWAMGIEPVEVTEYMVDGGHGAPNYIHHKAEYTEADEQKVDMVIKHMAEQGYIKFVKCRYEWKVEILKFD